MKLHPRVTRAGVALVKRFEGYRRHAARLADGGFVLGYGHTLSAREGGQVSEADAEALLWFDLSRIAEGVEAVLLAPVSAPQFEALTSLAFNIGLEDFARSTVVQRLNEGAYLQAAAAIELWRRADFDGETRVVDALVRRRAAEKAHFLTPPEGFATAPSPVVRPAFDHAVVAAALAWGEAREHVVVSAPALDGASALAALADPPGRDHGDVAPSACLAAADAVSARLSRILPDPQPDAAEPELEAKGAADAPSQPPREAAPPPPAPASASAPVRAFAFEPLPAPRGAFSPTTFETAPSPVGSAGEPRSVAALLESPTLFAALGLVGVALFLGAVAGMFKHPSLLCLLGGLAGVLAMAPAAAFFLFRVIGAPEPPSAEGLDTALVARATTTEPEAPFGRRAAAKAQSQP